MGAAYRGAGLPGTVANRADMSARVVGFSFVAFAGVCDVTGAGGAAFYMLLIAVCGIAVAALGASGDWLETRNQQLATGASAAVALLWSVALVLAVLGSSVRSAALDEGAVPTLGDAALAASLAVFVILGVLSLRSQRRRRPISVRRPV